MLDTSTTPVESDARLSASLDESPTIRKGVSVSMDPVTAAAELHEALYHPDMSLGVFYCSPDYDLPALGQALKNKFGDVNLIGCTTSGEITPNGYLNGSLTGVAFTEPEFVVETGRIDNLERFAVADGERVTRSAINALTTRSESPTAENTFGLLLIDGMSRREEAVVSSIHQHSGDIQIFGGSAGDGIQFSETYLYHDGEFRTDCALFSLIQTDYPFVVFKTQHFVDTSKKMVVTEADPDQRIVTEINALPAGREYARVVGLDVRELTPLIFAAYPVIVKIGGEFFVRSIQQVNEDESLTFFCAIDEGIVLTVAEGVDMVENLEKLFVDIRSTIGEPSLVLGCDCLLRLLEIEQKGIKAKINRIMTDNNVIGFSTYGEQFNAMHVNQTFTGVAIGKKTGA